MVKHHLTPPLNTSICGSRRPAVGRSATPTRAVGYLLRDDLGEAKDMTDGNSFVN